ncbi:MAG TPA: tRNA preQ1(34) S-adenosylmethionine ribosyltransferase-isomerase QueA [Gemmatimonadales bacterium]|nr:tRNA preQ1(34) S-adenosylmethionine ribosyltransferase-isomerase QueA [Gemmatimonadales bacterium]
MAERGWTTADFDFDLPAAQIAQHPSAERGASRMLIIDRGAPPSMDGPAHSDDSRAQHAAPLHRNDDAHGPSTPMAGDAPGTHGVMPMDSHPGSRVRAQHAAPPMLTDAQFSDLLALIPPGDLLVLNSTKVRHARFLGTRPSGIGTAEVLLIHPAPDDTWIAMGKPGSAMRPGKQIRLGDDAAIETIEETPDAFRRVRFVGLRAEEAIAKYGRLPLPPYISRDPTAEDEARYQTVYAAREGSVAAPTAGLHFTPALLHDLRARGVEVAELDLEVGPGTFKPVEAEEISAHAMHSECFEIPAATAEAIGACRARGGRVWAVGTTVVRALESAARDDGTVAAGSAETSIMITPGYTFRVVDRLITNFHLPRSTLLMLVAAFAGYQATMAAYRHAVADGYRFYSYGDAMCVVGDSR